MIFLIAFSDLLSTKTLDEWKKTIVDTATLVGLQTTNWIAGGYTRTLVALFARLYQTAGDVVKIIAASGFLDTATGAWLTLLAKQVFNVDRIEAEFAAADDGIKLTNTGGGLYDIEENDIVFKNSATGKTYRNTSAGTLLPGVGQILRLDLIAEEAGSGSNSSVGAIDDFVTTGFEGVTVTNEVALIGIDEEKDPDLRERCRDSLATLAVAGIKKAYEFVAKSARRPDGSVIGVTRVKVQTPVGDGTLTVDLASASGAVASDDVAIIQTEFDTKVTPYGFNATAESATNQNFTAANTIWIPSSLGLSDTQAKQAVLDALTAYSLTLPIGGVVISGGGKIYWRALLGVIEGSISGTIKAQLVSESDISVPSNNVPVFTGVLADTTVVQVAGI
jgi:hypothetical protein